MPTPEIAVRDLLAMAQSTSPELNLEADGDGVNITLLEPALAFHHSFAHGPLYQRAHQSGQAVLRACNNKQRNIRQVLDLTAGWGVDSLTLASHGQQVTMLEQSRSIYAVVAYSLEQLASRPSGEAIAKNLRIEHSDAQVYLKALGNDHEFDCIYLDPMFPTSKSGAKPGKEMQILQALTTNLEIEACFELALQRAYKRVVVKRPARAPRLNALKPDLIYREKTIRFDIYLVA